jgi:Na+/H+-dicarboxylate symporter
MWKAVIAALLLGILFGSVAGELVPGGYHHDIATVLQTVTDLFLRLIKMIVAPLVFASLVTGIAHMGDTRALGRIAVRTLGWFLGASVVSLAVGAVLVNLLRPGTGLNMALPATGSAVTSAAGPSAREFVTHLVPRSIFEALASNDIIQIVVFAGFVGLALATCGEVGRPLVRAAEGLMAVMLRITGYVMRAAPLAVFAAVANAILVNGLGVMATLGAFVGGFYLSLAVLWFILLLAGFAILRMRVFLLIKELRSPILLAFSAASSEAAFPQTLTSLTRFGIPPKITSFVLPLGYSFNLDGSMMYCTFAVLFIAQAYGIELSIAQQLTMLLLLLVTSKGMAAVPRASLVVISATLSHFGIPEAGLLLILAVDHFLDMGRSGTNVIGNAIATAAVARWEGKRDGMPITEPQKSCGCTANVP